MEALEQGLGSKLDLVKEQERELEWEEERERELGKVQEMEQIR